MPIHPLRWRIENVIAAVSLSLVGLATAAIIALEIATRRDLHRITAGRVTA